MLLLLGLWLSKVPPELPCEYVSIYGHSVHIFTVVLLPEFQEANICILSAYCWGQKLWRYQGPMQRLLSMLFLVSVGESFTASLLIRKHLKANFTETTREEDIPGQAKNTVTQVNLFASEKTKVPCHWGAIPANHNLPCSLIHSVNTYQELILCCFWCGETTN